MTARAGAVIQSSLARDRRVRLLAGTLAGAWVASLAAYVWFWTRPLWLPRWPLDTSALDPTATLGLTYGGLAHYIAGFSLPMVLYAVALFAAWRLAARLTAGPVVVGALGLAGALWLAYPILAADVFDYLMIGRIIEHYHQNPYVHVAAEHPEDPYAPPVGWPDLRSVYGPLFNASMVWPAFAAGDNMFAALLLFKAFVIGVHGANTWVVYRLARESGAERPVFAALAFGWSPLTVIHFGVDGHNDALMMLLVGLGALAALRRRHELALPLITAAALIKFVPVILLPPFLLAARRSPKQAAVGILVSLALTAAAFAPQWAGTDTFDGVRDQGSRQTSSIASLLTFALDSEGLARGLMVGAFVVGYGYTLLNVRGVVAQTFVLLSLYLATVAFWLKGWYVTWPLMFGAALGGPALAVAAVWSVGPLIAPVFGAWGWLMYWWDWHRRWGIWMMELWLTASLLAPLAAAVAWVFAWRWLARRAVRVTPT